MCVCVSCEQMSLAFPSAPSKPSGTGKPGLSGPSVPFFPPGTLQLKAKAVFSRPGGLRTSGTLMTAMGDLDAKQWVTVLC